MWFSFLYSTSAPESLRHQSSCCGGNQAWQGLNLNIS